jgi:hypothetical protein
VDEVIKNIESQKISDTVKQSPREVAIRRMMDMDGCDVDEANRRWSKIQQRRNGIRVNGKTLSRD